MVAPIRELANITHSTTVMANISNNSTPNSDINMVINPKDNIFNISDAFKERRSHSLLFSIHKLRFPSISSSKCSENYHICVKRNSNRMDENEPVSSIGSIKIDYMSQGKQNVQVSKVTDTTNDIVQCVPSKDLALNSTSGNNMFNINLSYDIDQALDLEEWDGDFCTTLLYGAMKHLVSDVKNIKDFL